MKKPLLLFIFLLSILFQANAQSEKNVVKSFRYNGEKSILLALDGDFEVVEWNEKIVRLSTTVSSSNLNETTLNALTVAGRYTSSATIEGNSIILGMPKSQRELIIRGVKVLETYKSKVYVPKGVNVEKMSQEEYAAHL